MLSIITHMSQDPGIYTVIPGQKFGHYSEFYPDQFCSVLIRKSRMAQRFSPGLQKIGPFFFCFLICDVKLRNGTRYSANSLLSSLLEASEKPYPSWQISESGERCIRLWYGKDGQRRRRSWNGTKSTEEVLWWQQHLATCKPSSWTPFGTSLK